jgi:hypothetical protein
LNRAVTQYDPPINLFQMEIHGSRLDFSETTTPPGVLPPALWRFKICPSDYFLKYALTFGHGTFLPVATAR